MSNENKFSINRIAGLCRFYGPAIRLHVILIATATIAGYLMSLWGVSGNLNILLYALGIYIVNFAYYSGPFMLCFCRERGFEIGVPASIAEKSVFTLGYIFIFVPAIIASLWYGSMGIASFFNTNADVTRSILLYAENLNNNINMLDIMNSSMFYNITTEIMVVSVALLVIVSVRISRFALGVAAVLGTLFVQAIIGGVIGVIGVMHAIPAADGGEELDPQVITDMLTKFISDIYPWTGAVFLTISVAIIAFAVIKIRNRQA